MAAVSIFHLNKGVGDASYAKNSIIQKRLLSKTMPFTEDALVGYFHASKPAPERISIADLGCSSGPKALTTTSHIANILYRLSQRSSCSCLELSVFLNDLPGNYFNIIFDSLPAFYSKLMEERGTCSGRVWWPECLVPSMGGCFQAGVFTPSILHPAYIGFPSLLRGWI